MTQSRWIITSFDQVPYFKAMIIMNDLLNYLKEEKTRKNFLLLLEHPPVITLGKRAKKENLLLPPNYKELYPNLQITNTDRGGDVTFHGPGQLIGYFVSEIHSLGKTVGDMVKNVGQLMIDTLKIYGIKSYFDEKYPGVWVTISPGYKKKIASIGMKIEESKYVKHGFALNVNNDLSFFKLINPCGLNSDVMTTMKEIGIYTNVEEVKKQLIKVFSKNREVEIWSKQKMYSVIGDKP